MSQWAWSLRDIKKLINDQFGYPSLVCIKDALWGRHEGAIGYKWFSKPNNKVEDAMKSLLTGHNGYVVLRLRRRDKTTAFDALRRFTQLFESSGYTNSYCSCFDGIPYSMSHSVDPLLGKVILMVFDCESG